MKQNDLASWLTNMRGMRAAQVSLVPRSRVREHKRALKHLSWRQKAIREREERERAQ